LTTADFTISFEGDSVAGQNHAQTTVDPLGLMLDGTGIEATQNGNASDTAEVQTLLQYLNAPSGGTLKLSFNLTGDAGSIVFDVEFDYDATAAEIETAIDAAAVAAGYTDWNGEITVSDGDDDDEGLTTKDVTLT